MTLLYLGEPTSVLLETEELTPLWTRLEGPISGNTVRNRLLRARSLSDLGRHDDAFVEVESLTQSLERARGNKHPDALYAQIVRAELLIRARRHDDALVATVRVLEDAESELASDNEYVIRARGLRWRSLLGLGRNAEADAEFLRPPALSSFPALVLEVHVDPAKKSDGAPIP